MARQYRNPQWLRRRHKRDGMSIQEIANKCDCTPNTIRDYLKKFDIPRNESPKPWRDKNWLEAKYIDEGKSMREIANEIDCSSRTICMWLDKHDIEKRGRHEPQGKYADPEWLKEQYWEKGLTRAEMAQKANVNLTTIARWLRRHELRHSDRGDNRPLLAE